MRRPRISILVVTAMAGLAWAGGCGDGATEPSPPPPEPPRATTLTVTPATAELRALDATVQLTAEVRDQNGNVMVGATVSWASSAATVATVSPSGLVTAAGNGAAAINATAGSASGSAAVTVAQEVSAVVVTPAADTLLAGDTVRLAAEARDANGYAVTGQDSFSWASSDTSVAAVDDAGLVTGIAAGNVEMTATASGITGSAELTVVAPVATTIAVTPDTLELTALGQTAQLSAEVRDQAGRVMEGVAVSWSSNDTTIVAVDSAGSVTATGNGMATLSATAGPASSTVAVTVAQEVSAVVVTPAADTLLAGDTVRLAAEARDANGHTVAGQDFSWTSGDTAVAAVDPTGLVTAVGIGEVEITATSSGVAGRATVTVAAPAATTVAVEPDDVTFQTIGDTVRMAAEVRDQIGRVMEGAAVSWRSADGTVAAVDSTGLVTALANGTTTITAMAGEASGTALVRVVDVDVGQFLEQNPRIAASMVWLFTDGRRKPYAEWPQALKNKLALAIDQVLGEGTGLPDVIPNRDADLLSDDDFFLTVYSKEDAEDLYLANVAYSLILEMARTLPWSLDDLSDRELEMLLGSQGFFTSIAGTREGYQGYRVAGFTAPARPLLIRDFMENQDLVGGSRYETIVRTTDWARRWLSHFCGGWTAGNFENHWGHRGVTPLARMLSGTRRGPDELCGPLTGVHHYTAGCHGTNWFFIHLLRAVNIPAEYIRWSGHATPHFPSEAMYLSHGDDPYDGLGLYSPPFPEPFPTSEILIPESKYTQWFNASNSFAENQNNVGRQMTELGVKYLSQWLLVLRCQDIANGVSNADSQVYRPLSAGIGRYWTVAELEAMNFWERMDAKIAQYGGCPIPPPVRPARDEPIDLGRSKE